MDNPEEKFRPQYLLLLVALLYLNYVMVSCEAENRRKTMPVKKAELPEVTEVTIVELYGTGRDSFTPKSFPIEKGMTYEEHWFGGGVTIKMKDATIKHRGPYAVKQFVVPKATPTQALDPKALFDTTSPR